jgi:hypothetical protein
LHILSKVKQPLRGGLSVWWLDGRGERRAEQFLAAEVENQD